MSSRGTKRKQPTDDLDSDSPSGSSITTQSELEIDISSALTGDQARKKPNGGNNLKESEDDDYEELEAIIRNSVVKRDIKEGTKVLKKAKGKTKLSKGEVGGGSFQSMGAQYTFLSISRYDLT